MHGPTYETFDDLRLLERIQHSPTDVLQARVSLPAVERVRIAARALTARPALACRLIGS